eukprot:6058311-Pyramimonas_sp.AAC.1
MWSVVCMTGVSGPTGAGAAAYLRGVPEDRRIELPRGRSDGSPGGMRGPDELPAPFAAERRGGGAAGRRLFEAERGDGGTSAGQVLGGACD